MPQFSHEGFNYSVYVFLRHWEAVKKWDEAIQLTPDNPELYEMKSQVTYKLLILISNPHLIYCSSSLKHNRGV